MTKMTGEAGAGLDDYVLENVLRLFDGRLSDFELNEFCSLLTASHSARQSYLQCVQTIAELHLYGRDLGPEHLRNSPVITE